MENFYKFLLTQGFNPIKQGDFISLAETKIKELKIRIKYIK